MNRKNKRYLKNKVLNKLNDINEEINFHIFKGVRGDRQDWTTTMPTVQPKILLKPKPKEGETLPATTTAITITPSTSSAIRHISHSQLYQPPQQQPSSSSSTNNHNYHHQPQIIIQTREKDKNYDKKPIINHQQPTITIQTKESITLRSIPVRQTSPVSITPRRTDSSTSERPMVAGPSTPQQSTQQHQSRMLRPLTLISFATHQINSNTIKILEKNNTDFMVIGVIGGQGVGKSTILNLLADNTKNADLKQHIFVNKAGIFPVKMKSNRLPSLPRFDSFQIYITEDRLILLDCPPILSNPSQKDVITSEIDDIKNIMLLLTICHLVLVIQTDYLNLNLLRLIQLAELARPVHDSKAFLVDYFPNILFIKNRGKRCDFNSINIHKSEKQLKFLFKDSQLRIHFGQTDRKLNEYERLNYFVMPEITGDEHQLSQFHLNFKKLINDFKNRIVMTPRNKMYNSTTDLNEGIWFDMFHLVVVSKNDFLLTTYEDTLRICTHTGISSGDQGLKDTDMID